MLERARNRREIRRNFCEIQEKPPRMPSVSEGKRGETAAFETVAAKIKGHEKKLVENLEENKRKIESLEYGYAH